MPSSFLNTLPPLHQLSQFEDLRILWSTTIMVSQNLDLQVAQKIPTLPHEMLSKWWTSSIGIVDYAFCVFTSHRFLVPQRYSKMMLAIAFGVISRFISTTSL